MTAHAQHAITAQLGEIIHLNMPWEEALHLGQRVHYKKGTIIPHTTDASFYYLHQGEVIISYCSSQGHERRALSVKPGCIFNEARSVSSFKPTGQFRCTCDTTLYVFPQNILNDEAFIAANPKLISNLLSSMGTKMLIHYAYLAEMGVGSPLVLLARVICGLMEKNNHEHTFASHMTQQEVANLLGIHRATLARAIGELRQQNIISQFTSRKVVVENKEALYALAHS